ncbi:nucleoside/nucleotide kinase family protein [Roseateles terrae]|uniref:Pantothenate kinase n=1 Tax=Roseateles terrae TaxID=431060 RepID=A0ABR6GND1_9BURK|nr:nucleoside/nucleotide kinase family protein [Roseateles terrae]MBB3193622.1 pantothenate kinase [Roseateles terrae]OWQ89215.1 nucleoside/nucleotide kinase family protein [Roseateles terrae]
MHLPDEALRRAQALLAKGGRRLLGIAGPPGAGKSTVAALLKEALGDQAQVVPMDGFHLAQAELERLGRAGRKGAPDTFDASGFVSLLRRLRTPDAEAEALVYAPEFRRDLEEPIAGALAVPATLPLVIVEGNYLLLSSPPWSEVQPLLDECWHVSVAQAQRLARLIARHERHGRSPQDARAWALGNDEPNARLVEAAAHRADWQMPWAEPAG